jgi:hypothetical protein
MALQRAVSALYRETVEMLLQSNREFALSEPRYSGELLYLKTTFIRRDCNSCVPADIIAQRPEM